MRTLLFLTLAACTTDTGKDSGDTAGDTGDTGDTGSDLDPVCTEPTDVECVDEIIADLSLHDDKTSKGDVSNTQDGDDWVSEFDASAGGYSNSTKNAFLYMRFTDQGLEKLDITDEEALESMDWDLGGRRFVLRLNGGDSGPSCVGAAVMGQGWTYEEIEEVPEGVEFQVDDYYTEACSIINDSSGLPGSPQVVLGPWWDYSSCVETTDQPFLVQLASGRVLKLKIEQYYDGSGQEECNGQGSTSAEGGYFVARWRFLN